MGLNKQQVARGVTRFLEAYPAKRRELESLSAELAECLGLTLEELRQQRSHELLGGTAKALGRDEFEFLLEFAVDSQEERSELLAAHRDAIRRALGE